MPGNTIIPPVQTPEALKAREFMIESLKAVRRRSVGKTDKASLNESSQISATIEELEDDLDTLGSFLEMPGTTEKACEASVGAIEFLSEDLLGNEEEENDPNDLKPWKRDGLVAWAYRTVVDTMSLDGEIKSKIDATELKKSRDELNTAIKASNVVINEALKAYRRVSK